MRNTNTCKLGVIILTLAMLATAFAVLPNTGAGNATNETMPEDYGVYHIKGKVISFSNSLPVSGVKVTVNNRTSPTPLPESVYTDSSGSFDIVVSACNQTVTFEDTKYQTETKKVAWTDFNLTTRIANIGEVGLTRLSSISGIVKNRAGIALADVAVKAKDSNDNITGEGTTTSVGAFTVYVGSQSIDVTYRKMGYFDKVVHYELTGDKSVGTVYMDAIVPEPSVLVFGVVQNLTGVGIEDVTVSVSRDGINWISNLTDEHGYYEMFTYSGRFKVKSELNGYYTKEFWASAPEVDRYNIDINMTETPAETNSLWGIVTDFTSGLPIEGATVKLMRYDSVNGIYETKTSVTTIANGSYSLMFPDGTFRLCVSLEKYFTNSTYWIDQTISQKDVKLTWIPQDRTLSGRILDAKDNFPIAGATVTIYEKTTTRLYENSTESLSPNGFYSINAYQGSFAILVDAPGYQGKLVSATIGLVNLNKDVKLMPSGIDMITKTYTFSSNWKNVSYHESRTLSVDNATLRAMADIAHGRGNLTLNPNTWTLTAGTVNIWSAYMEAEGLPMIYTTDILALDNNYYELVGSAKVNISNAIGSVETSMAAIGLEIFANYTMVGTVAAGTEHELLFNASYDTETTDNVYMINLLEGYEMTANTSSSKVKMAGFTAITVDTLNGTGAEKISMTIMESDNGTAKIRLTDGTFYEKNSTYKGYEVIVRKADATAFNSTVKFSASESTDPVGQISLANFTWNFKDGSNLAYGITATHNYTTAGTFKAILNVTETGGNKTNHTAIVHVDEAKPTAVINVLYHTISTSNAITINEDNQTSFTGGNSTDTITGTTAGIIQTWQWSWGDGSANDTMTKGGEANINHTYLEPGTYTLKMNVTDVVGHVSVDKSVNVTVMDVTKPTPDFKILNSTYAIVTGCRENVSFYFNSTSTDNHYSYDNLTYTWNFGDGSAVETAMNTTHTFTKIGTFNVTLNVTDLAGNWDVRTTPVSISLGIRPDLMLYANTLKIDPKTVDDGQSVKLSVNITNKGEADATGTVVTFFIRNSDGTNDRISGTVVLTNTDGTTNSGTLSPKKNATASLSWKPSGKGNYTIYVTANCTGEHSSTMFDNNNGATLNAYVKVNASPMIQYAIAGVAIGVFIVGAVVYFFWVRGKSGGPIDDKRKKK
ncbi:MAG: PKD domain-containing protein [Methanobacteriota archaeon]